MSVSPDATLGMVDKLAAGFDQKVLKWMEEIKEYIYQSGTDHSGNSSSQC